MLTVPDLKALAAYLRTETETNAHCARRAAVLGHPKSVTIHEAKAEQLDHWAAGVAEIAETKALAAVDAGAGPELEGLTDGLIHQLCLCPGGTCPKCRRADDQPAATFSPNC